MSQCPDSRKWACEYCTYENWPASKRCTLCRSTRVPQLISEAVPPEQDIYKMAPLICSPDQPPSPPESTPVLNPALDHRNKWSCQACTYLNWPKSVKCTQCLTPRPVPILTRHSPTSDQPLNINVSIAAATHLPTAGCSSSTSPNRSHPTSPNSPEAAKAANNDRNKAIASSVISKTKPSKWICKACTYQNWPKSNKCVLCGITKGKTYAESAPSSVDIMAAGYTQEGGGEHNRHRSPPVSARTLTENIDMVGAMAALPVSAHDQHVSKPPSILAAKPLQNLSSSKLDNTKDKQLRHLRTRLTDTQRSDLLWLPACHGIVEGDVGPVEAYLCAGGDPGRQLTAEETCIRPSAFETGYTLVHLAIRFQREDMLSVLLAVAQGSEHQAARKRMPPQVAPDMATEILREISLGLRQRKGDFPCYFLKDAPTFVLPADIDDFPLPVRKQLFNELLDQDVQKELEEDEAVINWHTEVTERLGSRLYALWNRTQGDCLLDSVLQASWGVFDRDNTLRRALADSLTDAQHMFYPRWKESEAVQAESLQFSLDESQWQQDWAILLNIASQQGSSLEQIHIFAIAHILRRPIIVYGIKFVKSYRGENLGFARFQGVYLPLLWEQSFCWKNPICLGYTRGHFSALVPMEIDLEGCVGAGANIDKSESAQAAYLPLMDCESKLLPIHFLPPTELGREESVLREWLECELLDSGSLLVAVQRLPKLPLLVKQMLDEWLERYRAPPASPPVQPQPQQAQPPTQQQLSSDEDTDDEE